MRMCRTDEVEDITSVFAARALLVLISWRRRRRRMSALQCLFCSIVAPVIPPPSMCGHTRAR